MLLRAQILEMEQAVMPEGMREPHAAHLRRVNDRSAAFAFVVEQAAGSSASVDELWARMNHFLGHRSLRVSSPRK